MSTYAYYIKDVNMKLIFHSRPCGYMSISVNM